MRKIKIFVEAFLGYPRWRVTYPDGGMTRRIDLFFAIDLWFEGGGIIWIDFEK